VQINHTWRECNRAADWLANFSLTLNAFDFHVMETPPRELQNILFDDSSERSFRFVVFFLDFCPLLCQKQRRKRMRIRNQTTLS